MLTYADICDFGRSPIRENAICARGIGLSGLLHEKCSDDFLAKPLICLWSTIDSAQVGLTLMGLLLSFPIQVRFSRSAAASRNPKLMYWETMLKRLTLIKPSNNGLTRR